MSLVVTQLRKYSADCTRSVVTLPSGVQIVTIERPWLGNRNNVSCYPEGEYVARWLQRSGSGKYRRVWHIVDVPGRTGILWHNGNLVRHSQGCAIVGSRAGELGGLPAVLGSKAALNIMRRELAGKDFLLKVTS